SQLSTPQLSTSPSPSHIVADSPQTPRHCSAHYANDAETGPQLDLCPFAFETTLSGLTYLQRLNGWKTSGYRIEIIFLRLLSPRLALRRIAARVRQGGH